MNDSKIFFIVMILTLGLVLVACVKTAPKETPINNPAQNTQSSGAPTATVELPNTTGIDDISAELNDSSLNNVSKDLDTIVW